MADSNAPSPIAPELLGLRTRIDKLDRDLLSLLNERAALAVEVGELKKRECNSR